MAQNTDTPEGDPDASLNAVRTLARLMIDSRNGYRKCADILGPSEFATRLTIRGKTRTRLLRRLQNALRRAGSPVPRAGFHMGRVHAGFTRCAMCFGPERSEALAALDDSDAALFENVVAASERPSVFAKELQGCRDVLTSEQPWQSGSI